MKGMRKRLAVLLVLLLGAVSSVGCNSTVKDNASYNQENIVSENEKNTPDGSDNKNSSAAASKLVDTQSLHSDSELDSEKDKIPVSSNVKTISTNLTELTLVVGKSEKLKASIEPSNAEDKSVKWTSSDANIATVDSEGVITAQSEGSCVISVKSASNPSVKADVHITVKKKDSGVSSAASEVKEPEQNTTSQEEPKHQVKSISLNFYETILTVGESTMPSVTMRPENAYDKSEIWTTSDQNVATVDRYGNITAHSQGSCVITVVSASNESVSAEIFVTVIEPSVEDPTEPPESEQPTEVTYINGILVVNKTYSLPSDYNPGGLTQECSSQFELLRQGAAADGINIYLSSGFRSYDCQKQLYNGYVSYYGQETADTFSARPGHSEHQTGLAIDCNIVNDSFIGTPEAIWLAEHCYEYGFIIRYPQGKESITGYKYEPWHIRYVGVDNAEDIYNSGLTLEEYLGVTSCY